MAAAAAYTSGCLNTILLLPPADTAALARSWGGAPYGTDDTRALCCLGPAPAPADAPGPEAPLARGASLLLYAGARQRACYQTPDR